MFRYQDQLAEISNKDLTVSPSLETSPLVLAILLVSVLLNMAAAPQLANIVSNILSNRDRSVSGAEVHIELSDFRHFHLDTKLSTV